ncbi:unnamed protein product [Larinioides sclopetarius]|uniref:Uncharacterized protein n=1 Tax=Larinioides sclopetarius TaxID=280406 RepID=A0AAV2AMQ6_9ARAC
MLHLWMDAEIEERELRQWVVSVFSLPKDEELKKKWLNAIPERTCLLRRISGAENYLSADAIVTGIQQTSLQSLDNSGIASSIPLFLRKSESSHTFFYIETPQKHTRLSILIVI